MSDDYLARIESYIRDIADRPGLEVVVNQMSTQLRGELDHVMGAIAAAMEASFSSGGTQVLVAKFLSADLPIGESP